MLPSSVCVNLCMAKFRKIALAVKCFVHRTVHCLSFRLPQTFAPQTRNAPLLTSFTLHWLWFWQPGRTISVKTDNDQQSWCALYYPSLYTPPPPPPPPSPLTPLTLSTPSLTPHYPNSHSSSTHSCCSASSFSAPQGHGVVFSLTVVIWMWRCCL